MGYRGWTGHGRLALAGWLSSLFLVWGGAGELAAQQPVAPVVPTAGPSSGGAPATAISLDEALRLAEQTSEQVLISQAGVLRARGQLYQARSQLLPQLAATAGYTRTLATQFSGLSSSSSADTTTGPTNCPSGRFTPNPSLPLDLRVDTLEKRLQCSGGSANPFGSLKNLPFGQKNQWSLGLAFSQNLFTGGRVLSQIAEANASRTLADIGVSSTRAQLMLDVAQAYYDAALSDRLLLIAQGALVQAQQTLQQVQLARQVGNQPEFELLRAQVAYQNEQPVVIQRRSQRDLAYMRLKQLLNLPSATPISLTTSLGDSATATPVSVASAVVSNPGDTTTAARAPVRQAEQALRSQEAALRVARSERIPSLALVSQWGKVGYTTGVPAWNQLFTNWTVGLSLSVPLFTGGRVTGDQLIAQAGLMEARARLRQTTELAALDTRSALEALQAAEATYNASAGTAQQASRAYQIADVRYREGISTQLELNDSRLMVQQAEANRAQAARDLQLARIRLALLPNLPLGASSGATNASAAGQTGSVGGTATQAAPQQSAPLQAAPQGGATQAPQGTTQTGTSAASASRVPINQ
ncbi:MAG TPA: TolC family protein [Longimicrobiales bacterium]